MAANPVILIHGYSDVGSSFKAWEEKLRACFQDREVSTIHVCSYQTLTNEVTIKDIAEGFDRALRIQVGLDKNEPFDAIVHSTGMLVLRAWLTAYAGSSRHKRLHRLIGLAPASFGSPLAHKGRSWLGSLFKGNRMFGPDFLEAGDLVLDGLELGSRFTWELTHRDLFGPEAFYGPGNDTPYVFIFCGNMPYAGPAKLVSDPGTDGTVRWAGCALNSRKIVFDLTKGPSEDQSYDRIRIEPWSNVDIPLIPVAGVNHGTILTDPPDTLVKWVYKALNVSNEQSLKEWYQNVDEEARSTRDQMEQWQQFVVRAVDERGDPVTDYNLGLCTKRGDAHEEIVEFDLDVHAYRPDPSLRCFHVNLSKLEPARLDNLYLRIITSSGSRMVGYTGTLDDQFDPNTDESGLFTAITDITGLLKNKDMQFFNPFTTTLIELRFNREPLPLGRVKNYVTSFLGA